MGDQAKLHTNKERNVFGERKWKKMKENVFSSLSALLLSVFHVVDGWLGCGCRGALWFSTNLSILKALGLLSTRRLAQRACLAERE